VETKRPCFPVVSASVGGWRVCRETGRRFCGQTTLMSKLCHNATPRGRTFKFWNESGTNRARIGDSRELRLRSPQHLASCARGDTRSGLAGWTTQRFFVESFTREENAESNQKRARVNRIPNLQLRFIADEAIQPAAHGLLRYARNDGSQSSSIRFRDTRCSLISLPP